MAGCVFCRIVAGEIPAARVYEDSRILAFMDTSPVTPGHTLVIPKAHASEVSGLSREDLAALGEALGRISPAVMKAAGAEGYNILNNRGAVAGQAVEHVHFHVIPRGAGDGRGYRWLTLSYREGELEARADAVERELRKT
jgi:histidine triad (HIT) family protein